MKNRRYPLKAGYTFIEVLATVAILGILAALVIVTQTNFQNSTKNTRLESHVVALNRAVKAYLNAGGNLDSAATPAQVIAKLKTVSDSDVIPGFQGSFIDGRLAPVMQSVAEANSNQARALWNFGNKQFFIASNGASGVKAFAFDESLADVPASAETRDSMMRFASVDGWIWDFDSEISGSSSTSGTEAPTGEGDGDASGSTAATDQLLPPGFSLTSGEFLPSEFNLELGLSNPNPAGSSMIYVAVDGGNFQVYETAMEIAPNTTVSAFCYSLEPEAYHSSFIRSEQYAVQGVILDPPVFSLTTETCCVTEFPKPLALSNPNGDLALTILYSLNGGEFVPYTEPIEVTADSTVEAYCRGDAPGVHDSALVSHTYSSVAEELLAFPTISPDGDVFEDVVMVSLAAGIDAPAGSRIYYTLDGTDPGVDEDGNPLAGTLYTGPLTLESGDGLTIDWDDSAWNDDSGWLDHDWDTTQTYKNIGGSGVDLSVNLFGGPPAGDIPGPNLEEFSPLGLDTHLRSTAGDLPDFYYSLTFSETIRLDDFSTGGLFVFFREKLANRIELFDPTGAQISLTTDYVTDSANVQLGTKDGGLETLGTSEMSDPIVDANRSTTAYDFGGLEVSEIRWWHYAYEMPGPDSYSGTSEPIPGAETVEVGNDTVTFGGVLYDYPTEGNSTWCYIVESGEAPEISHVTFDIGGAEALGGVGSAGTWSGTFPAIGRTVGGGGPEIGFDRKTAAWGIKYDEGFAGYEQKRYYFVVDGNYARTTIAVHTKASTSADTGYLTGPALEEAISDSAISFSLINADTDELITGYEVIEDGMALDLAVLPPRFTIRANTNPTVVGSVRFSLNGDPNTKVENMLPYTINGDNEGDYLPWYPDLGDHTLVATPYTESWAGGTAGIPLMIRFSVINTADAIGHDKSSFLTDINFRVDEVHEIVARVYPPAGDPKCKIVSEPVSRKIRVETSRP